MVNFPPSFSLCPCCTFWATVILPGLIKARNTFGSGLKVSSELSQQRRKKGRGSTLRTWKLFLDVQTRELKAISDGNTKVPVWLLGFMLEGRVCQHIDCFYCPVSCSWRAALVNFNDTLYSNLAYLNQWNSVLSTKALDITILPCIVRVLGHCSSWITQMEEGL